MRRNPGAAAVLAVLSALALATSGCASALSGHGSASVAASDTGSASFPSNFPPTTSAGTAPTSASLPTATGTTSSPTPSPTRSSPPPPSQPLLSAAQVDARIERPPAAATPWSSAWARSRHPSMTAFVQHVYAKKYVATEVALLRAEGLRGVTHQTWYAPSAHQADMVLLRFATTAGAVDRFVGVTGAKAHGSGDKSFPVSGNPYSVGYYSTKPDSLGNIVAIVYGRVANVVVEEFYFSPHTLSAGDAVAWMKLQLRRLAH